MPCRQDGDVLLSYEIEPGGSAEPDPVTVRLYRWHETTADTTTGCSLTGTMTGGAVLNSPLGAHPLAQGAINEDGAIANHLDTDGDGAADTPVFVRGTFGEAGINVTAATEQLGLECAAFGQVQLHSRASVSITSAVKDYVAPVPLDVDTCRTGGAPPGSRRPGSRRPGSRRPGAADGESPTGGAADRGAADGEPPTAGSCRRRAAADRRRLPTGEPPTGGAADPGSRRQGPASRRGRRRLSRAQAPPPPPAAGPHPAVRRTRPRRRRRVAGARRRSSARSASRAAPWLALRLPALPRHRLAAGSAASRSSWTAAASPPPARERQRTFTARIRPDRLSVGVHQVTARVVFRTASRTRADAGALLPALRAAGPSPRFTG